jgi:hypothetical protein
VTLAILGTLGLPGSLAGVAAAFARWHGLSSGPFRLGLLVFLALGVLATLFVLLVIRGSGHEVSFD